MVPDDSSPRVLSAFSGRRLLLETPREERLVDEVARLQNENAALRREIDMLKDTAAFGSFAPDPQNSFAPPLLALRPLPRLVRLSLLPEGSEVNEPVKRWTWLRRDGWGFLRTVETGFELTDALAWHKRTQEAEN